MLDNFIVWLRNTENWLLGAMPFLGAFIALAREYEKSEIVRTWNQHIKYFVKYLAYAWAISITAINLVEHYQMSKQITIISCILGSIYAKSIIDMTQSALLSWFKRFLLTVRTPKE